MELGSTARSSVACASKPQFSFTSGIISRSAAAVLTSCAAAAKPARGSPPLPPSFGLAVEPERRSATLLTVCDVSLYRVTSPLQWSLSSQLLDLPLHWRLPRRWCPPRSHRRPTRPSTDTPSRRSASPASSSSRPKLGATAFALRLTQSKRSVGRCAALLLRCAADASTDAPRDWLPRAAELRVAYRRARCCAAVSRQLDADGNEVGTGGTPDGKHSVNAVASLDWTISPVETVWWGEEGAAGSVSGDRVRFTVPLAEDGDGAFAEVILDATLFKKNGTLRSVWDVKAGDSKFELTINNWPFCAGESGNPCQGAVGTQLQVTIAVSGPAAADKADSARSGLDVYKFGSTNAVIALNSDIWVNSVLAQGNVTFSGGSIVVTFDKPEDGGDLTDFNWDPVMSLDGENMVADASGSATTTAGAAALSVACLLAAIATARTE